MIGELNLIDHNGELRQQQQAEEGIQAGLALIEELKHAKISTAVEQIKRALPDLLHYFDYAIEIVNECKTLSIDKDNLKALFLAWQWVKVVRKSKKSNRKNWAKEQEQRCLNKVKGYNRQGLADIQEQIYSRMDQIIQSSALVECINSIIHRFLNTTKNQVTQTQLNLIMFYHNHRCYRDGKRKSKTPMELLLGKEQTKDWISLIFDLIRKKDPDLIPA